MIFFSDFFQHFSLQVFVLFFGLCFYSFMGLHTLPRVFTLFSPQILFIHVFVYHWNEHYWNLPRIKCPDINHSNWQNHSFESVVQAYYFHIFGSEGRHTGDVFVLNLKSPASAGGSKNRPLCVIAFHFTFGTYDVVLKLGFVLHLLSWKWFQLSNLMIGTFQSFFQGTKSFNTVYEFLHPSLADCSQLLGSLPSLSVIP